MIRRVRFIVLILLLFCFPTHSQCSRYYNNPILHVGYCLDLVTECTVVNTKRVGCPYYEETVNRKEKATAWVFVAPGEEGMIRLAREQLNVDVWQTIEGITGVINPLLVSTAGDMVYSSFHLESYDKGVEFSTNVWLRWGTPQAIGTINRNSVELSNSPAAEKSKNQSYTLYVTAFPIRRVPGRDIVSIGNLAGFNLLWERTAQNTRSLGCRGSFRLLVPGDLGFPSFGVNLRLTDDLHMEMGLARPLMPYFELALEKRLPGEELRMGIRAFSLLEGEDYLTLGFSDQTEFLSGLTLSAGYFPLIYDITRGRFVEKEYWWLAAEYQLHRVLLALKFCAMGSDLHIEAGFGYGLDEEIFAMVLYQNNLQGAHILMMGIKGNIK